MALLGSKRARTESVTPVRTARPIDARTDSTASSSAGSLTTRTPIEPLTEPASLVAVTVTDDSPSDAGATVSRLPASVAVATSGVDETAENRSSLPSK